MGLEELGVRGLIQGNLSLLFTDIEQIWNEVKPRVVNSAGIECGSAGWGEKAQRVCDGMMSLKLQQGGTGTR